ncbi:hypothetical protein [Kitasatospora griseola]|uniref:hypothetical protein n=1 Tax=Kitasatospora griseola TaxID=2064 RepID=UPI00342E9D76
MPPVRWVGVEGEPRFLARFPAQRGEDGFARFHAAARRGPDDDRSSEFRNDVSAEQDAVVFVENDRTGGVAQRHP